MVFTLVTTEASMEHGTRIDVPDQNAIEDRITSERDVLKSIVYGGLTESIASLGVVSSSAGSDATTLNTVALGLANLIGGLFVIAHGLRVLRNGATDQNEEKLKRYKETLGQKDNFWLHATVVFLSYFVFGILPPIVYGFSFRKSDNKEYKLISVTAASLVCIILLAIGKCHVQEAPKTYVQTVMYYVCVGVATMALSYAIGELIKALLENLHRFDSGATVLFSSAILEMVSFKSGWESY